MVSRVKLSSCLVKHTHLLAIDETEYENAVPVINSHTVWFEQKMKMTHKCTFCRNKYMNIMLCVAIGYIVDVLMDT